MGSLAWTTRSVASDRFAIVYAGETVVSGAPRADLLWYGDEQLLGNDLNRFVLLVGLVDLDSSATCPSEGKSSAEPGCGVRVGRT